jgi:Glycosyl transferases group 1
MIEAMACGTPILAFRHGSVAEVVEDGITGQIVDSVDEAICKIGRVLALDRARVRRRFEERFTARRMVRDYINLYEKLATMGVHRSADRAPATVFGNGSAQQITSRPDDIRPLPSRSDV